MRSDRRLLVSVQISLQKYWPVHTIETEEHKWQSNFAGKLKLKIFYGQIEFIQQYFSWYLPSLFFVLRPIEAGDDNELHDAAEHEDHTRQHPNVQERDVRHAGNVVTDLNIFLITGQTFS